MFNKILAVVYFILGLCTIAFCGSDQLLLSTCIILSSLYFLAAEILDAVKGAR